MKLKRMAKEATEVTISESQFELIFEKLQAMNDEKEKLVAEREAKHDEFRSEIFTVFEEIKTNTANNQSVDYSQDLEDIKQQISLILENSHEEVQMQENSAEVQEMSFFADGAILFLVLGVLPVYFVFRLIRSQFRLLNHIF